MSYYQPHNGERNCKYSNENCLKPIQEFIDKNGRIPKSTEYNKKNNLPSYNTICYYYGTIDFALKKLGYKQESHIQNAKRAESKACELYPQCIQRKSLKHIYDLDCIKGYKLEVKSCRLRMKHKKTWFWEFRFSDKQKEIVDYFVCFGYDKEFNKLKHLWLIKNENITGNKTIYIGFNKLNEWSKYEQEFK